VVEFARVLVLLLAAVLVEFPVPGEVGMLEDELPAEGEVPEAISRRQYDLVVVS